MKVVLKNCALEIQSINPVYKKYGSEVLVYQGYINQNGAFDSLNSMRCSEFIPLFDAQTIEVSAIFSNPIISGVAFYSEKNYDSLVSNISDTDSGGPYDNIVKTVAVPNGAKYAVFSALASNAGSAYLETQQPE